MNCYPAKFIEVKGAKCQAIVSKLLVLASKEFQKLLICSLVIFAEMSEHLSVIQMCIFVFLSQLIHIISKSIPTNIVSWSRSQKSKNNDDDQNEIHIFIAKGLWCFDLLNINCILPLLYDKLSQWHNVCDIIICLKPFTVPLCTSYFWSHFFEVLIEVEKFWSKLCVLLDGSRIIPHNT